MIEELYKKLISEISISDSFTSQDCKKKFIDLLKKCNRINYTLSDDKEISLGASKVGGLPDLQENLSWPMYNGDPLTFFCQINLSDLTCDELPNTGILHFFVYTDPENPYRRRKQICKIFFNSNVDRLKRLSFPESINTKSKFTSSKMHFFESFSYPDSESVRVKDLFKSYQEEILFYYHLENLLGDYHTQEFSEDKVLGYDCSVQTSTEQDWAITYLNFETWDEVVENKEEIDRVSKEYSLLLQMDIYMNPSKLASYGGSPEVYFGINNEDLKSQQFENVIAVFQDT